MEWLQQLASSSGSDLHLKVNSPPMIREIGRLRRLDRPPVGIKELADLAKVIIPPNRRERFEEDGEVDFAHSVPGVGRFRGTSSGNVARSVWCFASSGWAARDFEEVGLPPIVQKLADEARGLILATGPTGSGKTTTLAAMIEHINRTREVHIVTIEDPIEVLYADRLASINQREVGQDSKSFLTALRAALRQDPDVILVGEIRDSETVRAALQAAETGHLVLSTLHTVDATETVNRVVDFFPSHQQNQVRLTLAGALRGIICQRLVPSVSGGRVPCLEILVNTGRVADRIVDPALTSEIKEVIAQGTFYGMRTFDQSLLELVRLGDVTIQDAMEAASVPQDLELMLGQAGLSGGAGRSLSFQEDVKLLFKPGDRTRMMWAFDLWDAAIVREHAADILRRLETKDLPFENGYPEQHVDVFRKWMQEGMAP